MWTVSVLSALTPSGSVAATAASYLGDVARGRHRLQDLRAAAQRVGAMQERVVFRRRLGQAGQERELSQAQLLHRLVEEHRRRGGHAVGGLAAHRPVRDGVQVAVEDPILGVLALELLGELGLDDLVLEIVLVLVAVGEVGVVDQLHRQCRGALQAVAALDRVLDGGADDALVVQRAVLVEAPVLDRDGRFLELLGDAVARDRGVDRRRPDVAQRRAVGGEHLGGRARCVGLERVQARRRLRHVDHPTGDGQRADGDHAHDQHRGHRDDAFQWRSPIAPASALSLTSAHGSGSSSHGRRGGVLRERRRTRGPPV